MAEDNNIVTFSPPVGVTRQMPERKPRAYPPKCKHVQTVIDEDLRIIECATCGVRLDPISVLLDIANHWGDYASAQMGRELQSFRTAAWYLKQIEERERRIPEERDLSHDELLRRHSENGCPPEAIKITRLYLECYCGVTVNRTYYREFERRVLEVQNAARRTLKLAPLAPAKERA